MKASVLLATAVAVPVLAVPAPVAAPIKGNVARDYANYGAYSPPPGGYANYGDYGNPTSTSSTVVSSPTPSTTFITTTATATSTTTATLTPTPTPTDVSYGSYTDYTPPEGGYSNYGTYRRWVDSIKQLFV